jgi:carboxypeptidase C (cathepsin A)
MIPLATPARLCLALAGFMALAPAARAAAPCADGATETRHAAVIGGKRMAYTACAGSLPVRDQASGATGRIFYTAYVAQGAKARPLTFVWNGGPGADSRLLHFHALGPRVIRGGALVDNTASPLVASDLVFVDPIGTGFSRADTATQAQHFYGTVADIAATKSFVSAFRTAYRRTDAPLYLAGESFGTWRAAGVAQALIEAGTPVRGMALISGGIPLGEFPERNLVRALSIDSRVATAHALGRLVPRLQASRARALAEANRWALQEYLLALAAPQALSPERRAKLAAELAGFQGLDPKLVDPATLWISPEQFRTALLKDQGKVLDVFDMRRTANAKSAEEDKLVRAYFRNTLRYRGGQYAGIEAPESTAGSAWQYDQAPITKESLARAMAGEGPPSPSQPWTLEAMRAAPQLRTWVAAGLYDSLNSCAGNRATVAALPSDIAARFVLRCFEGGHMMYDDPAETLRFGREFAAFVRTTT